MNERWLPILLIALAIVSMTSGVLAILGDIEELGGPLWDLDFYRAAAARWVASGEPYLEDGAATGYFYSPIVTPLVARVFHGFEADLLYTGLVALAIAAALALGIRAVGPSRSELLLCWAYALAFANGEVLMVLVTGNLAWLVGLSQAGALYAASRERWPLFYALVGAACLIKPYSLVLLVVPFVLRALSGWALLSIAPLAADALGALLLWPELAANRSAAIGLAVIEPLQLRYSLAGRLSRFLAHLTDPWTATTIAVAIQLVLAGWLVLWLRRDPPAGRRAAFALAAIAALAAIPRQAGYDAYAFGPAVFVGLWSFAGGVSSRSLRVILGLALAAGLFKEGLVILPILVAAALLLSRRRRSGTAVMGTSIGASAGS